MEDWKKGYQSEKEIDTIPVGPLALIPLSGCAELGSLVDEWLVRWRTERQSEHKSSIVFEGYQKDSYIIKTKLSELGGWTRAQKNTLFAFIVAVKLNAGNFCTIRLGEFQWLVAYGVEYSR